MNIFITIAIILVASYLLKIIAKKIKIPGVVALILAGLVISIPRIEQAIIEPNTKTIFILGDVAFYFNVPGRN
jgi:Kef-type K+ transport system membrane component KefB